MSFNISGLVNNIKDSISNLVDQLLGKTSSNGLYPDDAAIAPVQNKVQELKKNWNHLPAPYTFTVVERFTGQPTGGFGAFELPLAPTSIKQSEEFAISIKPTQGGTVVTHSGNKYKTLNITGTTGVAPFRGSGGVTKDTGDAIFQPNQLKYKSGYEVFLELRNYFKSYYEYKKKYGNTPNGKDARLIFKNFKDGDFLVVELLNFTMERSSARPFLYDYSLEFKVLQHFQIPPKAPDALSFLEQVDQVGNTVLNKIDLARGIFLRSQGILRQVESTYDSSVLEVLRKTALAVKALLGIGTVAADMGNRIINKTVSAAAALGILEGVQRRQNESKITGAEPQSITDAALPNDLDAAVATRGGATVTDLNEALLEIDSSEFPEASLDALDLEQEEAFNAQRSFYEDAIEDLKRIKANAEDKFNLGSTYYDSLFDRTSTVTADSAKVVTDDEFDVLNAFNEAISALQLLMSNDALFKSDYPSRIADMNERFENEIALSAEAATKEIILPRDTDLERLAQIELGDSTRWVEIAELNGLKSPYIIQDMSDTTSNVKHPGDKILIPQPQVNPFSSAPAAKQIPGTANLSELEKSLGTDLKVTPDFDLSLGNSQDLLLISGGENLSQAVVLKLGYEKGELIRHPEIGVGLNIGGKFPDLITIRDDLVDTLTQDSRIDKLTDLAIRREASTLKMHFNIKIKQIDVPIPVEIKL